MKRRFAVILLILALLLWFSPASATIQWTNNATSVIADVGGISAGATSLSVTAGHGDRFPAVASPHYFMVTLVDSSGNREIVKVTARTTSSNTMTIERAQEGTSARVFAAGSLVELRVTKNALDYLSKSADIHEGWYVCDASAADQGVTTNSRSLKSLVDTLGSTQATIVCPHTGTGATTTYTLGTDLTIPATITLYIPKGALISASSGKTLTMNGIVQAGAYQVFTGAGTVTVSTYPQDQVWWGNAQRLDANGTSPIGALMPFAGSSAPTGWLLCYGQAVSRTTYAALFAVISTNYGSGDGSTTFNVPDLRGRALIGLDNLGGSAASRVAAATSLGQIGGAETMNLSHSHTGPSHTHTTGDVTLTAAQSGLPSHNHSFSATDNGGAPKNMALAGTSNNNVTLYVSTEGGSAASQAHNHGSTGAGGTGTTSAAGSSTQASMNPYIAASWIIKY